MKVEVLQVDEATFKKWSWWSCWIDIAVFSFGGYGYLLQMKISRINAKRFKCRSMKSITDVAQPRIDEVGDLIPTNKVKNIE